MIAKEQRAAILFANLKGNLGDFAILKAMIEEVGRHHGECAIDVYAHPLVGVDKERLEDFKSRNPGITIKSPPVAIVIAPLDRILVRSWFRKKAQARLVRKFAEDIASRIDPFAGYEVILVAGGDQWSGRELGLFMFGTLTAIRKVNPNIRMFPFSLKASIVGLYGKEALRGYFGLLQQPVVVRDSLTKGLMDKLGADSVLGADCVFSLARSVDRIQPFSGRNASRILFVVKGPREVLLSALQALIRDGAELELLSTCPAEDDSVYGELARDLGLPYHAPLGWEGVIAEFRASSLVVTNRLHGLILGSLAGVPLLPVTDRKKSLAFARDADMPYFAARPGDISVGLIDEARANRETILGRIRNYMDHCRHLCLSPFTRK